MKERADRETIGVTLEHKYRIATFEQHRAVGCQKTALMAFEKKSRLTWQKPMLPVESVFTPIEAAMTRVQNTHSAKPK